ncbi:MAG: sulfatase/phosphatase domain-containing protein, partial [Planctomycetota bacterium]
EVHAPFLPPSPFRERFTAGYSGWIRDYCDELEAEEKKRLDGFSGLFKRRQEFSKPDVDYLIGLYDGEIAYTDAELARFWNFLDQSGTSSDLLAVIVSDHGEEFGEHGEFSHKNLYDSVVHVPLVITLPAALRSEGDRHRIPHQACLVDVMPTLIDLLRITPPPYLQGRSLIPLWQGEGFDQPAYSEVIDFGPDPLCHSVRDGKHKLLNYASGQYFELFDLEQDKDEKADCSQSMPDTGRALLQLLNRRREMDAKLRDQFRARSQAGRLPSDVEEDLRKLGY